MIQRTKLINGRKFIATCSKEYLSPQAEWLLALFEEIEAERGTLTHGMRIQAGWTMYTLVERDGAVEIVAPDYNSDPFSKITHDLSTSLSVQLAQNHILEIYGIEGEFCLFQDKIVVAKGVFTEEKVYLERSTCSDDRGTKGDSGWYLGPVKKNNENIELEAYYIYQLLNLRPSLLKALAVARGYLVVFEGEEIEAVLDENNNRIMPRM